MELTQIAELMKNIAIPSAVAFVSYLVYRWQRTSKQIEIIQSFRSAFLSKDITEQNLAFSLLISLPEKPSIRQAFYCLSLDLQNSLLKSAFIGAIRNTNTLTLLKLLELFPNYKDIIYGDTPLYIENGLPHYGPISYYPIFLHKDPHHKKAKLLFILLENGEPLDGFIFNLEKITNYDNETGEIEFEQRQELKSPIYQILFTNNNSIVKNAIRIHLKHHNPGSLDLLVLMNYTLMYNLINSLIALIPLITAAHSENFDRLANIILLAGHTDFTSKGDAKKIFATTKNSALLSKPIKLSPDVYKELIHAIEKHT